MIYYAVFFIMLAIDQISKYLTIKYLHLYESITVIENVLSMTYVRNTGGPWSILNSRVYIFVVLTLVLFIIGFIYFIKNKPKHPLEKFSLSLISSGAIGNFIDRIVNGYVIDMIDVNFFNYPVFNFADCFIVVGVILMSIYILFIHQNNEVKK